MAGSLDKRLQRLEARHQMQVRPSWIGVRSYEELTNAELERIVRDGLKGCPGIDLEQLELTQDVLGIIASGGTPVPQRHVTSSFDASIPDEVRS